MSLLHDLMAPPLRAVLTSMGRRRLATITGTLKLPGLKGPVEVLRDRWGVPHLYAKSERDVYMAQGYVHAQERLWQMDFTRRVVSGRLAEVLKQPQNEPMPVENAAKRRIVGSPADSRQRQRNASSLTGASRQARW